MAAKYGEGTSYIQRCDTCTYEQEINTEGVHVSEIGSVRVYSANDEFRCPHCSENTNTHLLDQSGKQLDKIMDKKCFKFLTSNIIVNCFRVFR